MRFLTSTAYLSLAALLLALSGCSTRTAPPRELIVGKWQAADGSGDTVEFTPGGVVRFVLQGIVFSGKYTFPEKNGIVLVIVWDESIRHDSGFTEHERHQGITIRENEVEIGGPDNQVQRKYRRSN